MALSVALTEASSALRSTFQFLHDPYSNVFEGVYVRLLLPVLYSFYFLPCTSSVTSMILLLQFLLQGAVNVSEQQCDAFNLDTIQILTGLEIANNDPGLLNSLWTFIKV